MNIWTALQLFTPPNEVLEPPAGASAHMREVIKALNGQLATFNERDTLKLVEEHLKRLKSAPAEERVAFVFEAVTNAPKTMSLGLALKGIVSNLLRGGLPLNTLEALRLVEMVSQRRQSFPYKALLSALEDLTMTPALKEALLRLRPMIDEWHGGREMQEMHERIDKLGYGGKEKAAGAASGW